MLAVNDSNFDKEVKNSSVPVICDFWAPWCSPCRILKSTMEQLSQQSNNQYKVVALDVDVSSELANQYKISSLPTVIVFKNGKETSRLVGVNSKEKYIQELQL